MEVPVIHSMTAKSRDWFVIAVGGVTCGGKTTLANSLHKYLPNSVLLCQDTYFYPDDSPHHVKVKGLDHVNYDILSSLDMEKMLQDVTNILKEEGNHSTTNGQSNGTKHTQNGDSNHTQNGNSNHAQNGNSDHAQNGGHTNGQSGVLKFQNKNVLILEGFCILNYKPIADLCDLKFDILLTKEECVRRRNLRVYDPPDIPGYFELCVWPEYLKHRQELEGCKDIISLDGTETQSEMFNVVLEHANSKCE